MEEAVGLHLYSDGGEELPQARLRYVLRKNPAVVRIHSSACGHCRHMNPTMQSFARGGNGAGTYVVDVGDGSYRAFYAELGAVNVKAEEAVRELTTGGVPLVVGLERGAQSVRKYSGDRTATSLRAFAESIASGTPVEGDASVPVLYLPMRSGLSRRSVLGRGGRRASLSMSMSSSSSADEGDYAWGSSEGSVASGDGALPYQSDDEGEDVDESRGALALGGDGDGGVLRRALAEAYETSGADRLCALCESDFVLDVRTLRPFSQEELPTLRKLSAVCEGCARHYGERVHKRRKHAGVAHGHLRVG
jgi:hypothetical protein